MTSAPVKDRYGLVNFELKDRIAVLCIDNPPVNAGSHAVRSGVVDAIQEATVRGAGGAVLIGAGRCFVAGSDLKEFDKPLQKPELPDVIGAIENAPFPVVAALHGVALGGGLELALGCDYRIAAPDTKLGLPEVSLGFVPGAGGTQRLPKLVGIAKAIELICSASRINAEEALKISLVDALAEDDLLTSALKFLTTAKRPKRRAIAQTPPEEHEERIREAEAMATKRGKGRPNVAEAIRLVNASAGGDAGRALANERSVFQQLRVSADAFALRYLFFAEKTASAAPGMDIKAAPDIRIVGVIGGGLMGQGIARACLAAGLEVVLVERDKDALDAALGAIEGHFAAQAKRGRLSSKEAAACSAAMRGATEFADVSNCDLVIEAVYEDLDVKKDVLARLEAVLPPTAIIASNTSYLNIDEMADGLQNPHRLAGLHFFSPADVMKLLEIVRTGTTSDATLAATFKFARTLGKQAVLAGVGEGFVGNRVFAAYRRRAELLVLDGATPEQVDAAVTDFGFAMGPFAVADMSGLDIAWAMRKRQAATRDPAERYVTIPDVLCNAGRLGRKTGKGWYDHSSGQPASDPAVAVIIAAERIKAGVNRQDFDARTIQRQLLAAIINEAALLLSEGIAMRPSDVDVVLANGYGFPRWRGGPLYWAALEDREQINSDLAALAEAIGPGFRAGPVNDVLDQIDVSNKG